MALPPVPYEQSDASLFVFVHLQDIYKTYWDYWEYVDQRVFALANSAWTETVVQPPGPEILRGAENSSCSALDVRQVVVELPKVVVPLVVHSGEDAAAGQLGEILGTKGKGSGTAGITVEGKL